VRAGAAKSVIELQFDTTRLPVIRTFLRDHDFDDDEGMLVVRREIRAAGSSRFFINDTPTTAGTARELGSLLVDFHGQYDHQSILRPAQQIRIIDRSAHNEGMVDGYRQTLRRARETYQTIHDLRKQAEDVRATQDYHRAQLEEIARVDPRSGEEEELTRELDLTTHAEELHQQTDTVYALLYAQEQSVSENLARVHTILRHLGTIDARFLDIAGELDSAAISVTEAAKAMQRYKERIEFHPVRADEIRERLVVLQRLRKRYGSIERAMEERERLERSMRLVDNFDEEMQRYTEELSGLKHTLLSQGLALQAARVEAGERLATAIEAQLKELGIPSARFVVSSVLRTTDAAGEAATLTVEHKGMTIVPTDTGLDEIVMRASMNAGEDLKPLDKVLSGGEASRVMLAVKTVMAEADDIPILVFDEIDTGISGRVAQKVGIAIRALSGTHQVLAITHQALIAALAHAHLLVRKTEEEGRTHVHAGTIDGESRVAEIAALLSGDAGSGTARARALELLEGATSGVDMVTTRMDSVRGEDGGSTRKKRTKA
ncbi:MAG: DNA repair protein RecN, partial [Candidatus Kapaibacterium sp.]